MSGFYSKMLINIRNLYFNNSDDMKTILHGIFLDAADVFLDGYTPSYCEENELIPTAQKFVEKFGSTKACETGVTKEAVASAMCNPAALVALMHDSDYDVLKEAFYYAWAKHISGTQGRCSVRAAVLWNLGKETRNIQSGDTLPLPRCRQCQNRQ